MRKEVRITDATRGSACENNAALGAPYPTGLAGQHIRPNPGAARTRPGPGRSGRYPAGALGLELFLLTPGHTSTKELRHARISSLPRRFHKNLPKKQKGRRIKEKETVRYVVFPPVHPAIYAEAFLYQISVTAAILNDRLMRYQERFSSFKLTVRCRIS